MLRNADFDFAVDRLGSDRCVARKFLCRAAGQRSHNTAQSLVQILGKQFGRLDHASSGRGYMARYQRGIRPSGAVVRECETEVSGTPQRCTPLDSSWSSIRMQADADLLVRGLEGLSGSDLPSPITDLTNLVKGKPLPRKAAQMGASINGFLRRANRPKSDIAAGVDDDSDHSITPINHITENSSEILFDGEPDAGREVLGWSSQDGEERSVPPEGSRIDASPTLPSTKEIEIGDDGGKDHFEALELGPDADQDDIKRAYRRLVMQVRVLYFWVSC
jgi:hypothetical protein